MTRKRIYEHLASAQRLRLRQMMTPLVATLNDGAACSRLLPRQMMVQLVAGHMAGVPSCSKLGKHDCQHVVLSGLVDCRSQEGLPDPKQKAY